MFGLLAIVSLVTMTGFLIQIVKVTKNQSYIISRGMGFTLVFICTRFNVNVFHISLIGFSLLNILIDILRIKKIKTSNVDQSFSYTERHGDKSSYL